MFQVSSNNQRSYTDAGFNAFFRRSLGSNPNATTLKTAPMAVRSNQLNFDYAQISGALGDTLRVGTLYLDGKTGRFSVQDDQGNEVVRLGKVDG